MHPCRLYSSVGKKTVSVTGTEPHPVTRNQKKRFSPFSKKGFEPSSLGSKPFRHRFPAPRTEFPSHSIRCRSDARNRTIRDELPSRGNALFVSGLRTERCGTAERLYCGVADPGKSIRNSAALEIFLARALDPVFRKDVPRMILAATDGGAVAHPGESACERFACVEKDSPDGIRGFRTQRPLTTGFSGSRYDCSGDNLICYIGAPDEPHCRRHEFTG
jgi:hypothetical protein